MSTKSGTPYLYLGDAPTYTVKPGTTGSSVVLGGLLVEATTGGVVQVAGAASTTVLGVAEHNANGGPDVTVTGTGTGTDYYTLNTQAGGPYGANLTVGVGHYYVTYAAAAAFGQLLKAAAGGAVTPFVSGTDTNPSLIVGRCTEPGGVTGAGDARALIFG